MIQDHYFQSGDLHCHGWLYLPLPNSTEDASSSNNNNNEKLPVVIMASGFGEQKDFFGFDVYAEEFVSRGFAVFLFDYRNFGASKGHPRNLVSPKRHVQDWQSAIDYITTATINKSNNNNSNGTITVDSQRIGLWGMSFGGGHVLTVASQRQNDTRIVGVVAQAPFLKTSASTKKSSKKRGKLGKFRLLLAGLQDAARGYMGLPPVVIPILGIKGQLAMMPSTPKNLEAYLAQQPTLKLGGWRNQAPTRGLLELKFYCPMESVRQNPPRIPVFLVSGTRDAVCPSHVIEQVHQLLPQSQVITRNASHLEIMGPDHAPQVGQKMANFFEDCFR
eukprot:Sro25_g017210.1 Uncharacterized 31.7 kDa protein in traX-finO intergenic region (332) ;mRNA; r:133751-134746